MAVCRECATRIVWARTVAGRHMALNCEAGEQVPNVAVQRHGQHLVEARGITADRPVELHELGFVAHWVTCPAAAVFRRTHPAAGGSRTNVRTDVPALF